MRLQKRWLSMVMFVCMALALLPTGAMGADTLPEIPRTTETELKQLERYEPSGQMAFFSDGTHYYVEDTGGLALEDYPGSWFACVIVTYLNEEPYISQITLADVHTPESKELTAEVYITVEDVERAEDTYRVAGTDGPFEDASAFRLPITVTVANTTPETPHHDSNEYGAELEIYSVELQVPGRFILELSENQKAYWTREATLRPGERNEYDGYLRVDDSSVLKQSKALTYTVAAAVRTNRDTLEDKTSFTVTPVAAQSAPPSGEYGWLPLEALDKVTDAESAAAAVREMTRRMSDEQKGDPVCVDLATLFAETAAAKAAVKTVSGGDIALSITSVGDLPLLGAQASSAVESALSAGGVAPTRQLSTTITLKTGEADKISIQADPSILTANVDQIRVETSAYALTMKTAGLEEDLKSPTVITAERTGTAGTASIKLSLPSGQMTNPVTVSLPQSEGGDAYKAIVKTDGSAFASKYNPVTRTMDGKINASGTYAVKSNEKSFSDISGKSAEMQKAILYLASKGIINGTSATEFSPDGSISRQQIAALLMRALGKVDNTASTTFTDVPKSSALYHAIASSQKHKVINGYSDNTFRGTNVISKAQIVTVSGRVLTTEMRYKTPADAGAYLGKYSDTVPEYARSMVALATREGLVVYRTDGTFSGDKSMTRGDAAIILYRLFQRIW